MGLGTGYHPAHKVHAEERPQTFNMETSPSQGAEFSPQQCPWRQHGRQIRGNA